ncbi:MAG: hypothetical protein KDM91_06895 [Verrucomicrobiae bacterium]|nr:hypothetical protein [Verrucomicrobiae bacterium]MCP5550996.1 hypothetical protein [Akkermansiaceae bacterium]
MNRRSLSPPDRLRILVAALSLLLFPAAGGRSEIVERDLGTDAAGRAVKGHVFQAGRGFGRARAGSSPLPRRRSTSRGRDVFGPGDAAEFYWFVPVIPPHCAGPVSWWRMPVRGGLSFSVTVAR